MKAELENLLRKGQQFIAECEESRLAFKPSPTKWSKKEILGHLIDSGIKNLQRFNEIQFEQKPFVIHPYNQDELVKVNNYQGADTKQVLDFWLAINRWILRVIELQTEETLAYRIQFKNGETSDLAFLMQDYVDHLAHHLNQIMNHK